MVSSTRLGALYAMLLIFFDDVPQVEESEPLRSRSSWKCRWAEEEGMCGRSGGHGARRGGRGWGWGWGWGGGGLVPNRLPVPF